MVVERLVQVICLISEVRCCGNKPCCEVEIAALLLVVKVATDLGRVVMIVSVLAGCFDECNVKVFCCVR